MSGDDATVERLRALIPEVRHPVEAITTLTYGIDGTAGERFEVTEEGDLLSVTSDPAAAADAVYVRAYRRAFEFASLAGWVRLHAVTAEIGGRRHLLVGPSGVGKTSLALELCARGHLVQGDESVLVRDRRCFAVPRGFHVKRSAEGLVPRFAAPIDAGLRIGDVSIVDPRAVNDDWYLDIAPVDDIVVLVDRGDEHVALTATALHETLEALVGEAFIVTGTKSALLSTLVSTCSSAQCYTLTRGRLGDMYSTLVDKLH